MSIRLSTAYSHSSKEYYPVVPANTQSISYASIGGDFQVSRLPQTDLERIFRTDPKDVGHLSGPYDVSLAETLRPIQCSVGMLADSKRQLGSCSLISANMIMVPCHCIEGLDVRTMTTNFGYRLSNGHIEKGKTYSVQGILEYDQELDYAILELEEAPGLCYGYLPLSSSPCPSSPALLHHPFGKPLQVSVHAFVQCNYQTKYLNAFHDSDYGSSGGAYIDPSGYMTAMHLGSERHPFQYNLHRLALPLEAVVQRHPSGIISRLLNGDLEQDSVYEGKGVYYLSCCPRNFIDFERFQHERLQKDMSYVLRDPTPSKPGVIIESYQKKHAPNWPGSWTGKKGSSFSLTLDEIVELAEALIAHEKLFDESTPKESTPRKIYWGLDKDRLGPELYKKLKKIDTIGIHAGFNIKTKCWEIHFFPS